MSLDNTMKQIYKESKPQKFTGPNSVLLEHKKNFESSCAVIEEHYGLNIKEMSVFEFYSRIESIKDKFKRQKDAYTEGANQ